jgi:hypothetical protein
MQTPPLPPILQTVVVADFLSVDFLTRSKQTAQIRRRPKKLLAHSSFSVQRPDLLDEIVDFFGRQLAGVFGHTPFAISNDVAQVLHRSGSRLLRDERWSAEMPALGSLSVTLRALLLIHGVFGEFATGGRSSCERRGNHQAHGAHCHCQLMRFQVAARQND